jgi:hypothetical protein
MSRRVGFFVIAAVACALLTLAAPVDLRWVPEAVAAVYAVLAVLTAIEQWAAEREHREP